LGGDPKKGGQSTQRKRVNKKSSHKNSWGPERKHALAAQGKKGENPRRDRFLPQQGGIIKFQRERESNTAKNQPVERHRPKSQRP